MYRIITDYLDYSAKRFPNKIAFSNGKTNISFLQLAESAKKIATKLIYKKIDRKPVVILMDKSPETIVSMMGIAYSGNFYTVLDSKMPESRMEKIMSILNPKLILTSEKYITLASKLISEENIIIYESILKEVKIDAKRLERQKENIIDSDVLYVLFTSGSTGIPKGVVISHRAAISYTEWGTKAFGIDNSTIIGNQTPFYFSMSVFDIFQTIRNGCTLFIIPKLYFAFPLKLLQFIAEHNINLIYWVPSALCLVANLKALGKINIDCLKKVLFAGEVMPSKQYNQWKKALPHALYANLYGPTETTDICNYYIIDREIKDTESIPIGNPCENTGMLILNDKNQMAAPDELGELCVKGSTLAYGYYGNQEKTRAAFVQNPLNTKFPEIIYRTGDLVKYNANGELVYVCRKDFQIKRMGHRIELGEIETAISSQTKVEATCCLYNTQTQQIIAFYTGNIEEGALHEYVKTLLPHYMIPNKWNHLKRFPINLNGKIDRVKLKELL